MGTYQNIFKFLVYKFKVCIEFILDFFQSIEIQWDAGFMCHTFLSSWIHFFSDIVACIHNEFWWYKGVQDIDD